MVPYFPSVISRRAIISYFITFGVVSLLFLNRVLPLVWILFGVVEVCSFFYFSTLLTKRWLSLRPQVFEDKLLWTSLAIRLIYMVFAYFFYDIMTGQPFMFHSGDEQFYFSMSKIWSEQGIEAFGNAMKEFYLSDSGEIYFTALICRIMGPYLLPVRIVHSLVSALTCVLIYRIAQRHFGESTARMAAIFCMLMPNLVYYCGVHLKETDMVFVMVLLVDSVDRILVTHKFDWRYFILALFSSFALFTFRTVLGAVALIAVIVAIVLVGGKLGNWWKRALLILAVAVSLSATAIGDRVMREVGNVWDGREENQEEGMEWRAKREGGNAYAKYASKTVFAPLIFTIPFPTMINTPDQENQQMLHGGNYIKNVMSGFTVFALVMLLISGEWRKHTLPIAIMMGYLFVITFSNFAHSERFHQPALPFELMFAAYGVSLLQNKHRKWVDYWLVIILVANVIWAWYKLAGRGLV